RHGGQSDHADGCQHDEGQKQCDLSFHRFLLFFSWDAWASPDVYMYYISKLTARKKLFTVWQRDCV
ncbi:MAG: hypothetical protein IJH54_06150, partial [Clostridia bacterium]|nr:hypothetical protein [Clostridia bacterium]